MPDRETERIGDDRRRVIEVASAGLDSYQTSREYLLQPPASLARVPAMIAREELTGHIRDAPVTWDWTTAIGESMRWRTRDRPRKLEVYGTLIVVSQMHVRCIYAAMRYSAAKGGSRSGDAEIATAKVHALDGKRIGFVRAPRVGGAIEYRPLAGGDGAPAAPWIPLPDHVRVLARDHAARGESRLLDWIARHERHERR